MMFEVGPREIFPPKLLYPLSAKRHHDPPISKLLQEPPMLPPQSMASFTPYTYLQCPCTSTSKPVQHPGENTPDSEEDNDEDERAFDPRAPRANYSLYPLEHLLYCEDCHQIRCPRCVLDEIVTWYCPNCLFEVPSSTVKSEGTRYIILLLFGYTRC